MEWVVWRLIVLWLRLLECWRVFLRSLLGFCKVGSVRFVE